MRLSRGIHAVPGAMVMPLAIGFGLVLAGVGASTASASITEYRSYPTSNPQQIVAGADGKVWYTDGSKCVYRMLASGPGMGQDTPFCAPTASRRGWTPRSPASQPGPDGALWFTGYSDDYIGRVTTSGAITWYPAPGGGQIETTPFQLNGITVGSDGNMWFTMSGRIRSASWARPKRWKAPATGSP